MKKITLAALLLLALMLSACTPNKPSGIPAEFPASLMPYISGMAVVEDSFESEPLSSGGRHFMLAFEVNRGYEETLEFYESRLKTRFNYEKQEAGPGVFLYYNEENFLVILALIPGTDHKTTSIGAEMVEYV